MDSLLREHARRGGRLPESGAPQQTRDGRSTERAVAAAAHLDADELSAFAENALPASARARHTAHLAECGDCRKLVTQIALASGVAEEIERREGASAVGVAAAAAALTPTTKSSSLTWGARLASLFGSGALRYAMPLAALLVVSAAVLLLMTGRRPAELGQLATSKGNAGQQPAAREMHHPEPAQPSADAAANQSAANQNQTAAAGPAPVGSGTTAEQTASGSSDSPFQLDGLVGQTAPSAPVEAGKVGAPPEAAKGVASTAPAPPAGVVLEARPLPTPEPPAPTLTRQARDEMAAVAAPTPTPAPPLAEDRKSADAREKDRFEDRAAAARRQRGHGPMRNDSQQNLNLANRQAAELEAAPKTEGTSARSGSAAAAKPAARRSSEARKEKSAEEARDADGEKRGGGAEAKNGETRSVGGRRFRREGNAWVDTAYRSSQATVRVSRGSEQYRSLVGDEPELGRIAGALGGEVVVVWKGRAYRIR